MNRAYSVLFLFVALASAHADVKLTPVAYDMTANGFSADNISCIFLTTNSQYFCDGTVGN